MFTHSVYLHVEEMEWKSTAAGPASLPASQAALTKIQRDTTEQGNLSPETMQGLFYVNILALHG